MSFTAVAVPLPRRYDLHIDTTLDCGRDKEAAKRTAGITWETESRTRRFNRFFCISNRADFCIRGRGLAAIQLNRPTPTLLQQGKHLRKKRDRKSLFDLAR